MKRTPNTTYYPPLEEKINVWSHGFGFVLSLVALVILVTRASVLGTATHIVSFSIFGASLVLLYAASTFFHSAQSPKLRHRLNILDHASIYILIAGTYTPFAMVTLEGAVGWTIFAVVWSIALVGIILKLFFTGRYQLLSTIMYVAMGWIVVFAVKPLVANLSIEGLAWLFAGGLFYTIGAIIFSLEKINYNHAIFHFFVLAGSFCHFISIYLYVLPG